MVQMWTVGRLVRAAEVLVLDIDGEDAEAADGTEAASVEEPPMLRRLRLAMKA